MATRNSSYDIVIVGAGVAGCALAHGLATITAPAQNRQLKIALLERSLAEPDRIVGELLQPGGCMALRKLGMSGCLDDIGAVPVRGYCVLHEGREVHIPYPNGHEGRSFHHGRFIMALRAKARAAPGVEVIEATVSELVKCDVTGRIVGARATRKGSGSSSGSESDSGEKEDFLAKLVIVADGCFSNFRAEVMSEAFEKPLTRSYFLGTILKDVKLPVDKHGTVALVKDSGPVLLYQIAEHDTRILIDVKAPLPADLKVRTELLYGYIFLSPCRLSFLRKWCRSFHLPYMLHSRQLSKRTDFAECPIHSFPLSSKAASRPKRVLYLLVMHGTCDILSRVVRTFGFDGEIYRGTYYL